MYYMVYCTLFWIRYYCNCCNKQRMTRRNNSYWRNFRVKLNFACFVFAFSLSADGSSIGDLSDYTISCLGARNVNFSALGPFCREVVDWSSGNLYITSKYRHHEPGVPLSTVEQDQVAQNTAKYLQSLIISTISGSEECIKVIKWYSCIQTFPYCPFSGHSQKSAVSYLPACEIHCDQIREHCGIDEDQTEIFCGSRSIGWNSKSLTNVRDTANEMSSLWVANANKNCLTFVPYDSRLLPPNRGPYTKLPLLYTIMTAIWTATACGWFYWCSIWRNSPNPELLRLIAVALCIRVGLAVISRQLWIRCNEMKYYCPNNSVSSADAAFRIFEAGLFCLFFIMGKGWTITRPNLSTTEWFLILLVTNLFLFTSFTFSSIPSYAPEPAWVTFTSVLYGYMFLQFLGLIWVEINSLRGQVRKLNDSMPAERTEPIKMKLRMYTEYFVAGCFYALLELLCQIMFALQFVPTLMLCVIYEIFSWLILVAIAYAFRPRELSAFFYMIPTSHIHHEQHLEDQLRPLPIVSVKYSLLGSDQKNDAGALDQQESNTSTINFRTTSGMDEFELELAPLLAPQSVHRGQRREDKQAMVVVNRDDGSMAIGLNHHSMEFSGLQNANEGLRNEEEIGFLDRLNLFHGGNPTHAANVNNPNNHRIVPTREI